MTEADENHPPVPRSGYSWPIGFIYVFNLVIGVGALSLPKAFAETGWILGLAALGVLALMSYCTSAFMIEAMSIANAAIRCKNEARERDFSTSSDHATDEGSSTTLSTSKDIFNPSSCEDDSVVVLKNDETCPILSPKGEKSFSNIDNLYAIDVKVEMGEMARLFFNKTGLVLYYIVIALYLYGDLAIYAAAVPKSLATVICGAADVFDHDADLPCNNVKKLMRVSVLDMYRIMLVLFTAALGPFVFLNISKTKILQIFTTIFRWVAFLSMIVLAIIKIVDEKPTHQVKLIEFNRLPNFFGVAVYSFMCQHSLPSILTPITNKGRLNLLLVCDFILVALFYTMVVMTATFAFPPDKIEDLYTNNFSHPIFLRYLLELFPAFTLSASFPIIGITLRENLKSLFLKGDDNNYGLFLRRFLFPLVTVIPPIVIAYCTHDIELLVKFTGMYAGAIIQYIIPVMLVYFGRVHIVNIFGSYTNLKYSFFRHWFWIAFVISWYAICFVFVTYNLFYPS